MARGEILCTPEFLADFLAHMKIMDVETEVIGQLDHDALIVAVTGEGIPEGKCSGKFTQSIGPTGAAISVEFEPADW